VTPEQAWLDAYSRGQVDPETLKKVKEVQAKNRAQAVERLGRASQTLGHGLIELSRMPVYAPEAALDSGYQAFQNWEDGVLARFQLLGDSPEHKAFRFHNLPIFRDMVAAYVGNEYLSSGKKEELYRFHPELAPFEDGLKSFLAEDALGREENLNLMLAVAFAQREAAKGYPWIKAHDKEARGYAADVNPVWMALSPAAASFRTAKQAANVKALTGRIPAILRAAEDGDTMFLGAMRHIPGFDASFDLRQLLLSAKQNAPAQLAEALYHLGMGAPDVAPLYRRVNFEAYRAPLFKHAGQLLSPTGNRVLDAAGEAIVNMAKRAGQLTLNNETRYNTQFGTLSHEQMKSLQHLSGRMRNAMNTLGKIPEGLGQPVHEILSQVPRVKPEILEDGTLDLTRTMASFRSNYQDAVKKGTIKHNSKAYEVAERAVELMGAGWDRGMNWWDKLSVNPKFLETGSLDYSNVMKPMKTFWDRPNIGHAEKVTDRQMERFVVQVATRNDRVAAVNALELRATDLRDKLGSLRERMRHLYEFAKVDLQDPNYAKPAFQRGKGEILQSVQEARAATGRANQRRAELGDTLSSLAAEGTRERELFMEALLDSGVSVEGARIPSMTELMTRRKQVTSELNAIGDTMKTAEKKGLVHGKEWIARQDARERLTKELGLIDDLRRVAGQKEVLTPSAFDEALKRFGDGLPEWAQDAATNARELSKMADQTELDTWRRIPQGLLQSRNVEDVARTRQLIEATGMGDAIRTGRGEQYMASLEEYVRQGRKTAFRVVRDLKTYRKVEDPLEALGKVGVSDTDALFGKRNAFGRMLAGYDFALGRIRTAQLFNPGTVTANFLDTAVGTPLVLQGTADFQTVAKSIRERKPAELYTWLGEHVSKFADAEVAALAKDVEPGGRGLYTRATALVGEAMTAGENVGRRSVWWHTYNDGMTRLTKQGHSVESADAIMKKVATKFTDEILVNYGNMAPWEKAIRRAFYYPLFNSKYFLNYAAHAAGHGTETVLAAKLLGDYFDGSDDQRGAYDVAGGVQVNPASMLASANILLRSADAAQAVLDPGTRMAVAALKVGRAVLGNENVAMTALAKEAGAAPDLPQANLSKFDALMAPVMGMLTSVPFAVGDAISGPLGMEPVEARKRSEHRLAQMVAIAAAREGRVLSPEEATLGARKIQATRAAISLAVPGVTFKGPAADVIRQVGEAEQAIAEAPPELQDAVRANLLAEPQYQDLGPLLRNTPAHHVRDLQKADMNVGAALQKGPLASLRDFVFGEGSEGGGGSIGAGGPPGGGAGGAGGFDIAVSTGRLDPLRQVVPDYPATRAEDLQIQKVGSQLIVTNPNLSLTEKAQIGKFLNFDLRGALQQRFTSQEKHDFVMTHPAGDKIVRMIRAAADADPYYAATWREISAIQNGPERATEDAYAFSTPETEKQRIAFSRYFQSEVMGAGPNAEGLAGMSLDGWQKKLYRDREKLLGYGINSPEAAVKFLDWPSLALARQRLPEGYGQKAEYMHFRRVQDQYPQFGKIIGKLQDAVKFPQRMDSVLSEANGLIAGGKLPTDFWSQVDASKSYRNLYENVGVAASWDEAQHVFRRLVIRNRDGKPVDVNTAALFEIALDPKFEGLQPFVRAAREGRYGGEIASAVNRGIGSLSTQNQELIDLRLAPDAAQTDADFREMGNLATGNYSGVTRTLMNRVLPPPTQPPIPMAPSESSPPRKPMALPADPPAYTEGETPRYILKAPAEPGPGAAAERLSEPPGPGFFTNAPDYRRSSPSQIIVAGLSRWQEDTNAYQSQQTRIRAGASLEAGEKLLPPPGSRGSYIVGEAQDVIAKGGTAADLDLARQTVQLVNSSAQGVYQDALARGDIEPGGDLGAAMYGLNAAANTVSNPASLGLNYLTLGGYGVYTGVKAGLNFGKRGQRGGGGDNGAAQRQEAERIRLQEQLRQQSIRDIRTRESDLARALSTGSRQFSPGTQAAVLNFQRRGSFASKVGMIDAIERELGGSLTPRW